MKGNISLKGTRERPEQSSVTELENHADEQCFLFAHICMRKGSAAATSSTSWLVNGAPNLLERKPGGMGAAATLKGDVIGISR